MISDNKIQLFLLNKLKSDLITAKYPPNYKYDYNRYKYIDDDDIGFFDLSNALNCYAYAMQFKSDLELELKKAYGYNEYYETITANNKIRPYQPGFISLNSPKKWTYDSLTNGFYSDCELLQIETVSSSIDETIGNDSYKIALMLEKNLYEYKDFHFMRQNSDGSWSEKCGYSSEIKKISSPCESKNYEVIKIVKIKKPKFIK